MNFSYETQGAVTYLVCELDPTEQLDSLTLGMLTNNHIAGLAPVIYTEMNAQRYLKYNISAKVSATQFFGGAMNKQRFLTALQNIVNAICSADEYMIDQNCFSMAAEHIFVNVSSCETALLCIPVISEKDVNAEVADFVKRILSSTQFDKKEDTAYLAQLTTYLGEEDAVSVYGLKDLVAKLQAGSSGGVKAPMAAQPSVTIPSAQQVPVPAATSFDSTISIDARPSMAAPNVPQPIQPPVNNMPKAASPLVAPARSPQPAATPLQPQGGVAQNVKGAGKEQAAAMPKPPVSNGPGFAIPGQPMGGIAKPMVPPAAAPKAQPKPTNDGEKKMSLFGLLSHYNKENAELYKKQKEEAKAKKNAAAVQPAPIPAKPNGGVAPVGVQGQQPNIQRPGGMPQTQRQGFPPPTFRPPVQPMPVQNSFNETTVLSVDMAIGETTVLNADPSRPNPCLTRVRTGEKIRIDKPVFRIGKEKSYVDYFIADNTAISRSHASIHTENGEYFIEDTNSTNHTYINGNLISSNVKTKLTNGDKVKLANEDFTFSV